MQAANTSRSRPRVLSICTGMGLLDRAFMDAGFEVVAGCEIDHEKRAMYHALNGERVLYFDLKDLVLSAKLGVGEWCNDYRIRGHEYDFDGIIGGPSCQSHSKLRAIRDPKFPDLTPLVNDLLHATGWKWYCFENVVPIDIPGAAHTRCNAMHYYQPHQSRVRWFTHSPNITPPRPIYSGSVDDLMAYSVVAGRIYGPKRGARLQGYPAASELPFPCVQLQHGLADAVPYPLAMAWAVSIRESMAAEPIDGTTGHPGARRDDEDQGELLDDGDDGPGDSDHDGGAEGEPPDGDGGGGDVSGQSGEWPFPRGEQTMATSPESDEKPAAKTKGKGRRKPQTPEEALAATQA